MMVLFKTMLRYKLFVTSMPLQVITRPCSKKNVAKLGEKCYIPTTCPDPCGPKVPDPCRGPDKDGPEKGKDKVDKGKEATGEGKGEKGGGAGDKDGPYYNLDIGRPVRLLPGKVRMGFIPEEWFEFFYPKTGVTGPYIFFVAVGIYLISKEKYVLEHEFYGMLSMAVLCTLATKNVGPMVAKYLDKEIDEYERQWNRGRVEEKLEWEEDIKHERRLQISCEGQLMLLTAKRENVKLQLEGAYRGRLAQVHNDVKHLLEYQVAVENIQRRVMHKNLIDWVVREVLKTYKTRADADFELCIEELAVLAQKEEKQ